jgi:GMP synthase-like glutamine amidotransferase
VTKTALVVANRSDADSGYVGERLVQRGYDLRTLLRDAGEVPADVSAAGDVDLVVLLGSEWSVHAPTDEQSLADECALVRSVQAAGVPLLGICYGAQVIAQALGGSVSLAPEPEVGWVQVQTRDPALVGTGPWLQYHVDTIDAPLDAEVVATNACGQQAFVLPGVLAVQFHPEVRPDKLADWVRRFPQRLADAGLDVAGFLAEADARVPASRASAYALVDAFLDRVARDGDGQDRSEASSHSSP